MADRYMTVRDFIDECLGRELTIERLKAYGNELDMYRQKYSETRGLPGYNNEIAKELIELVGYLRGGLPHMMERIKEKGKDPKTYVERFVKDNISPETLSFKIRLEKPLI